MKRTFLSFSFCLAALLLAVSCVHEPNSKTDDGPVAPGRLILSVGGDATLTRATASSPQTIAAIPISEPGDELGVSLSCSVSSLDDYYFPESVEPETKGAPIYTETFKFNQLSSIPFTWTTGAPASDGSLPTISNAEDVNAHLYTYDNDPDKNLVLFLSAPAAAESLAGVSDVSRTCASDASIVYNGVTAFDYESPTDATAQKDILFTSKTVPAGTKGRVDVLFYHALAGVKFKSENARREGSTPITTIESVTITKLKYKGHCTVTPTYDQNPGFDKSAAVAKWTNVASDTKDFSISGLGIVNNTTQFPSSTKFEGETGQADTALGQYNINDSNFEHTFMFVPQTTTADVELTIVYHLGTNTTKKYTRKVSFKDQTWEAGKLYTYTLAANHVGVLVEDNLDETQKVKQNLAITSTGNVDEYIRAAIVGNWFDTHSPAQVVCPWGNTTIEGEFSGFNSSDWIYSDPAEGGDGLYYYIYKVRPGEKTLDLFKSYNVGTCPSSMYIDSAHLEIEILAQAIDASKLSSMKESYGWKTDLFTDGYAN